MGTLVIVGLAVLCAASARAGHPSVDDQVREFLLGVGYDLVESDEVKRHHRPLVVVSQQAGYARSDALSITRSQRVGDKIHFDARAAIDHGRGGHVAFSGSFNALSGSVDITRVSPGGRAEFSASLFHRGRHATVDIHTADPAFKMKIGRTKHMTNSFLAPGEMVRSSNLQNGLVANAHRHKAGVSLSKIHRPANKSRLPKRNRQPARSKKAVRR